MKRQYLLTGVALLLLVGAGLWYFLGRGASPTEGAGTEAVSALVKTAPVTQQSLALTMTVFGEVTTGKAEALGFAQAGQLAQLAVLPGQQLRRGDLIAILASDPNAQSAYAQASSAFEFAQRELRRNQDLLTLQLATASQVDAAARQLKDAQASLEVQRKLGGAQSALRLLAPFDAVVTALPASQGERLQAGATVALLGRTDHLRVQLAVEPAQSAQLHAGMPVAVSPVQESTRTVSASITEVQAQVDPKTQLVTAIVALPNDAKAPLLAGMRVQALIKLGARRAWSVPRQAVLSDDKGAYLYQVAKGKAIRVEVVKLVEAGQLFGVEGKLDATLPVVVLGNYELEDHMAVREDAR